MSRRKQESEEVEPKRPVVAGDVLAQVTTRALALEEVALALASSEDVDEMAAALLPVVAGAVGAREAARGKVGQFAHLRAAGDHLFDPGYDPRRRILGRSGTRVSAGTSTPRSNGSTPG